MVTKSDSWSRKVFLVELKFGLEEFLHISEFFLTDVVSYIYLLRRNYGLGLKYDRI